MSKIPYTNANGSLLTILCTRQYISFTVEMVSRFQSTRDLLIGKVLKESLSTSVGPQTLWYTIFVEIYVEGYSDTIGSRIKMSVSSRQVTQFYYEMEQFHGVAINSLLLLPRMASKQIDCSLVLQEAIYMRKFF